MMHEPDITRLQITVERLEATPDVEERHDLIAGEIIQAGGVWSVPSDAHGDALCEIRLHGISASALGLQDTLRAWIKAAKGHIASR